MIFLLATSPPGILTSWIEAKEINQRRSKIDGRLCHINRSHRHSITHNLEWRTKPKPEQYPIHCMDLRLDHPDQHACAGCTILTFPDVRELMRRLHHWSLNSQLSERLSQQQKRKKKTCDSSSPRTQELVYRVFVHGLSYSGGLSSRFPENPCNPTTTCAGVRKRSAIWILYTHGR